MKKASVVTWKVQAAVALAHALVKNPAVLL